ncbi:glycosyltransferase family 4 protein [Vibrio harveyi]
MKALFVHDHVFLKTNSGDIYSPGGFPRDLWDKYTSLFEQLTVLARCDNVHEEQEGKHVLSAFESDPINFEFVPAISSPKKLLANSKSMNGKIQKLVSSTDVVIARLPSENGLKAIKYAKEYGVACIVEVVGCAWDGLWNYGSKLGKLYAPLAYLRMRRAVRKSDSILYVTNEFLQARYPASNSAITVAASNVNINFEPNLDLTPKTKEKLIIGLIGNYKTNYKGIDIALEAASMLKLSGVKFELRILGNGNPSSYAKFIQEKGLESHIHFFEPLPSGKPVLNWLDNIDIYIQPSRQEGLPRALIEAMSRGCLCIGSSAGGIPELLLSDFVHDVGSAKGLYDKIVYCTKIKDQSSVKMRNYKESEKYDRELVNFKRREFFLEVMKNASPN